MLRSIHSVAYNAVADNTGLSFLQPLFAPKSAKSREIPRAFELIAGQGHPRSSILVSIESAYVTSYQSLIVSLDVSPSVFEILTFKSIEKWLLSTPPLFDVPAQGNPSEFLDETYPVKTRGMGLPYDENFIILTSTFLTDLPDRQHIAH